MDLPTYYIIAAVSTFVFVFININYPLIPWVYLVPLPIAILVIFLFHKYDMQKLFSRINTGGEIPSRGEAIEKIKEIQDEADGLYSFKWQEEPEKIHMDSEYRDINGDEKRVFGIVGPWKHPNPQKGRYFGRLIYMFPDETILKWNPECPGDEELRQNPLKGLTRLLRTEGYKSKESDEERYRRESAVTINTPAPRSEEIENE